MPYVKPDPFDPTATAQALLPKLRAVAVRRPAGAGPPINVIRFVLLSWTQYGAPWLTPEQQRWLRTKLASRGRWIPSPEERARLWPELMRWAGSLGIAEELSTLWKED